MLRSATSPILLLFLQLTFSTDDTARSLQQDSSRRTSQILNELNSAFFRRAPPAAATATGAQTQCPPSQSVSWRDASEPMADSDAGHVRIQRSASSHYLQRATSTLGQPSSLRTSAAATSSGGYSPPHVTVDTVLRSLRSTGAPPPPSVLPPSAAPPPAPPPPGSTRTSLIALYKTHPSSRTCPSCLREGAAV